MHYSDEDFQSYMRYLKDDGNNYFDTKFLSRLEHQTKFLKQQIGEHAAEAIAIANDLEDEQGPKTRLISHFQKAAHNYNATIDNIEARIKS